MQETVGDLHNIMWRDFYVISPCESVTTPGKIHEGTRLTIQYHPPDGYDYSIRTPGTPPRWADFEVVRWLLERKKSACVRVRAISVRGSYPRHGVVWWRRRASDAWRPWRFPALGAARFVETSSFDPTVCD